MKKYILSQLTQASVWIGLVIILSDFIAPRSYIMFLGIILTLTDDTVLKKWVSGASVWAAAKIEELTK